MSGLCFCWAHVRQDTLPMPRMAAGVCVSEPATRTRFLLAAHSARLDFFGDGLLEPGMPEPYCLAMVLCDAVHRDAMTGKFTLLGTFSTLYAAQFPAKVMFCVYFSITDGLGKTTIRTKIVDSESLGSETNPIFEMPADFEFSSPLLVMESVALVATEIPKPGLYHCELYAGNELLMARRLLAVDANEETPNA
jgi:hypothetical protein